ncbi:MAG: TetR family transcriptional regulator C-terminal domain-containing protein [Candidatus Andeanibacterium colombiense]|uniref:TetR family transcriptional regulator C-terminal domain-containing protein n=1 Tax=Candidatus Andeanibacterium colombiense TaxID=3121345 RepID=A0AAJ5X641_9SPHN|nr:MAG: TetR family transcriptional regulator C-terminal domain-containing protein [Sphingomonadaceae bacterium]
MTQKTASKRQHPDDRRKELLDAAKACLARLGPRATTGREICRQAGVSHGLLRHYFDNADTLLRETYRTMCDEFLTRFEQELAAPSTDPWETMDRFFAVLFSEEWASSDMLGAWAAFWTLVHSREDIAEVGESYNRRLSVLLDRALALLPRDPAGIARADAAAILSAVMDGLWLDYCLSPTRLTRERAFQLYRITLRRIAPR